jgi:hypothetical protein
MSMSRRCDLWKATDYKWYLRLGDFEYAYDDRDCTCYGPFVSEVQASEYLGRFSNPGSIYIDHSGTIPPPEKTLIHHAREGSRVGSRRLNR